MGFSKLKNVKVICLNAVACSGKTIYMNGIAGLNDKYPSEYDEYRPITLSMGGFFRETLGVEFFKDLPNPSAPEITDNWVKSMMHHALTIGYYANKDIIIDSFPRKPHQLQWLMNSSFASIKNIKVEMRFLYVGDDEVHKDRIALRLADCKTNDEKDFLRQRIKSDVAVTVEVYELTKKMIASGNYKYLSLKEVTI